MRTARRDRPGLPLLNGEERLSPRLKISLFAALIASLFVVQNIFFHAGIAFLVIIAALLTLPPAKMKRGLFPIALFLLFTFAGNLFFHSGRILYSTGILSVTDEGIHSACVRTFRVFSMIGAAKILTAVLSVDELIRSLEDHLGPLERIGIPVKDFFSVMGLTMKSFPVLMTYLLKEYRDHMKEGAERGVRARIRRVAFFLMPVFVKSIQSPESFFVSPDSSDPAGY